MKKSAFTAIFAIAAMVLSSLATPCRAQVITPERMEEFEKNNVLPVAEQMPEFPGGMHALIEYMQKRCATQRNAVRQGLKAEPSLLLSSRRTVR